MSRRPVPSLIVLATALWVGVGSLTGCREQRRGQRRSSAPGMDRLALGPRRPLPMVARRAPAATSAERAHDAARRAALRDIVTHLDRLFRRAMKMAAKGSADPAFRPSWPAEREEIVRRVGKLRAKVLAVDPLGGKSWAAREATRLMGYLSMQLLDAIEESWRVNPSGALTSWRQDFFLIWSQLQRYVNGLKAKPPKKESRNQDDQQTP